MLEITCSGTPYEIGFHHGRQGAPLVQGSLEFYEEYFQRKSSMHWDGAIEVAQKFIPFLEQKVPHLVEEMRGIADGATVPFISIMALNVRTEISMGMMDDGCTSLSMRSDQFSIAGQNWDWEEPQKDRLILMHIKPNEDRLRKPKISQVTEAGLLSKSGLNSFGVGVFINAIRARGVNFSALPVHLALRMALESKSRLEAIARLRALGISAASHILIADETGATSLESSHLDLVQLEMVSGQIAHTNHFLARHVPGVEDTSLLPDSYARMKRISSLLYDAAYATDGGHVTKEDMERMLEDEEGFPTGINRKTSQLNPIATLFSIVADLKSRTALIRLGRPTECEGIWNLKPGEL